MPTDSNVSSQVQTWMARLDEIEAECRPRTYEQPNVFYAAEDIRALLTDLAQEQTPQWQPESVRLIAAERERQIQAEGWTPEHDDTERHGELLRAAMAYLMAARGMGRVSDAIASTYWPWESASWKPSDDPIRNLVKAGALIAAEIDRLQRLNPTNSAPPAPSPGTSDEGRLTCPHCGFGLTIDLSHERCAEAAPPAPSGSPAPADPKVTNEPEIIQGREIYTGLYKTDNAIVAEWMQQLRKMHLLLRDQKWAYADLDAVESLLTGIARERSEVLYREGLHDAMNGNHWKDATWMLIWKVDRLYRELDALKPSAIPRPALEALRDKWLQEAAKMKALEQKFPDRFTYETCAGELDTLLQSPGSPAPEGAP